MFLQAGQTTVDYTAPCVGLRAVIPWQVTAPPGVTPDPCLARDHRGVTPGDSPPSGRLAQFLGFVVFVQRVSNLSGDV